MLSRTHEIPPLRVFESPFPPQKKKNLDYGSLFCGRKTPLAMRRKVYNRKLECISD
jgi:hypothetical protein